jgi:hypothetical protein
LPDELLAAVQRKLLNDPDAGAVMPGCGGLRKMRVADPKRGKWTRGGVRVIYLHVPEAHVIFLMDIYGKDERADLNPDQKKILKRLAESYESATIRATKLRGRGTR